MISEAESWDGYPLRILIGFKAMNDMSITAKRFIYYIATLFVLSSLTAIYVVQMTGIRGSSMEPELKDGQRMLVNKILYEFKEPKRYDVIVFRYLYKDEEYYCKRIIGLPGETVQILEGKIYIDGKLLEDPFASGLILKAGRAENAILLGEDEYFVVGDNRNFSSDSRDSDIGNVSREQILGKVFAKLWPLKPLSRSKD